MKNIFLFLAVVFCLGAHHVNAQTGKDTTAAVDSLPYLKYPKLPAFNIMLLDSATVFNTFNILEGRASVLMLFSPDCEHCKRLTEKILKGMDSLKDVNFYMFTPMKLSALKPFYDKFHLGDYKNIKVVGRDYEFFFFSYYGAKYVPYLAVYDKHKKLLKGYPDGVTVKELYEITH